ncbi:hypothetical protein IES00_004118 [Salmonella enterica subsp. enterica serovar Bareilly]|nr:hypothetical protein [Salmonella enterica subsp. enterica serovar Bareilly]
MYRRHWTALIRWRSSWAFGGTPTLVVLSSVGASADNISVIPGFTQAADLQKAIDKSASTTKNNLHAAGINDAGNFLHHHCGVWPVSGE